jgi:hypothetical protein
MDRIERDMIIRRCCELASECLRLIPAAQERDRPMLVAMAEHWTNLAEKTQRGEKVELGNLAPGLNSRK